MPAHRYVLASRSEYFRQVFAGADPEVRPQLLEVKVSSEQLFMQLLTFLYTDSCDLLQPGTKVKVRREQGEEVALLKSRDNIPPKSVSKVKKKSSPGKRSAYQVYQENKEGGEEGEGRADKPAQDPVSMLAAMATEFGVKSLKNALQAVEWDGRFIAFKTSWLIYILGFTC